jgi:predicted site-specific integrase-resolvase
VTDMDPGLYVMNGEAAQILNIAPSTMRQWAREGRIHHLTDPNGWRYYRAGDVYALRDSRGAAR